MKEEQHTCTCTLCINSLTDGSAVAARDGLFGLGVGTILFQNVNCIGNEESFIECSRGQASTFCTHFQDAGVDCLGRPLRKLAMCTCECVCICMQACAQ